MLREDWQQQRPTERASQYCAASARLELEQAMCRSAILLTGTQARLLDGNRQQQNGGLIAIKGTGKLFKGWVDDRCQCHLRLDWQGKRHKAPISYNKYSYG